MLLQISLYRKTIPAFLHLTGQNQGPQENIKTVFMWMDCEPWTATTFVIQALVQCRGLWLPRDGIQRSMAWRVGSKVGLPPGNLLREFGQVTHFLKDRFHHPWHSDVIKKQFLSACSWIHSHMFPYSGFTLNLESGYDLIFQITNIIKEVK